MNLAFLDIGAPEMLLILTFFAYFPVFGVWGYRAGSKRTIGSTAGLLLGLFLGLIGIVIVYCTNRIPDPYFFPTPSSADELKKYKQLLDSGAITEAEYDIQKAKILNR